MSKHGKKFKTASHYRKKTRPCLLEDDTMKLTNIEINIIRDSLDASLITTCNNLKYYQNVLKLAKCKHGKSRRNMSKDIILSTSEIKRMEIKTKQVQTIKKKLGITY